MTSTKYTARLLDTNNKNRLEEFEIPTFDGFNLSVVSLNNVVQARIRELFPKDVLLDYYKMPKPSLDEIAANAQKFKYGSPCVSCGKYVFFYPNPTALQEGHIYSDLGMAENRITRLCEYCFDAATLDEDSHTHATDLQDD